jgi:hypothetical protein
MSSALDLEPTLLEQVRGLIERTYDHASGLGPLSPYLIGDLGYRRLVSGHTVLRRVEAAGTAALPGAPAPGAQLLLRTDPGGTLRAALYFPDRLIRALEEDPPGRGLNAGNVDAFAAFVEEIDHLLLVAARWHGGPALSLLELELHANVTKDLAVRFFLARAGAGGPLPPEAVAWCRYHLFEKSRFTDPDPAIRERYRDAAAYALRYLRRLARLPASSRLTDLRRFSRMSHHQKLRLLAPAS